MTITGEALIAGLGERGADASFQAWNPSTRAPMAPDFYTVNSAHAAVGSSVFDPQVTDLKNASA